MQINDISNLREYIYDKIKMYKQEFEIINSRIDKNESDLHYQEDILEDMEDRNLIEGILEGLHIVLMKII